MAAAVVVIVVATMGVLLLILMLLLLMLAFVLRLLWLAVMGVEGLGGRVAFGGRPLLRLLSAIDCQ